MDSVAGYSPQMTGVAFGPSSLHKLRQQCEVAPSAAAVERASALFFQCMQEAKAREPSGVCYLLSLALRSVKGLFCRKTFTHVEYVQRVWDQYYISCRSALMSASWGLGEKDVFVDALMKAFPRRKMDLLVAKGDMCAEVQLWERAVHLYKAAYAQGRGRADVGKKLYQAYVRTGRIEESDQLFDELVNRTGQRALYKERVQNLTIHDQFLSALNTVRGPVSFEGLSRLKALTDIYISMCQKDGKEGYLVLNFWDLVRLLDPDPKPGPLPHSIAKNGIQVVDHICRRYEKAEQILQFLIDSSPYQDSVLQAFTCCLQEWHAEIKGKMSVLLQKCGKLRDRLQKGVHTDAEQAELAFSVRMVREFFSGGSTQDPLVGVRYYIGNYQRLLERAKTALQFQSFEQKSRYEPLLDQWEKAYKELLQRVVEVERENVLDSQVGLSSILAKVNSKFFADKDESETATALIQQGNMFSFITEKLVPKECRENVRGYLESEGIKLEDVFSSSLMQHVPNTRVVLPDSLSDLLRLLEPEMSIAKFKTLFSRKN